MDINEDLVNRALLSAGQEPLNKEDISGDTTRWRTCKAYYMQLLIEMLSEAEWTNHKRRKTLTLFEGENLSKYNYCYTLPVDCAKPIEIQQNDEYIVEDNFLYTDTPAAVLLYVSNGRRENVKEFPPNPSTGDRCLKDGELWGYTGADEHWIRIEEDYPEYEDLGLSPEESKCLENTLAAQIVLKITGDPNLYRLLFSIAQGVKDEAIKQSRSHGVSRENGSEYWGDRLGLTKNGVFEL